MCTIPATSVPCERLFSAGAKIATNQCNCLGSDHFEHLQVLKYAWRICGVVDEAAANSAAVEEIPLEPFKDCFAWDSQLAEFEPGTTIEADVY